MAVQPSKLGEHELEILKFIAQRPEVTSSDVAEHFADARQVARTTVVTMMERLRNKGYLIRKKSGGVFRYSSRIAESTLLQSLMRDFVDRVLGGSMEPFVSFLAGRAKLTERQVENLTQIIREIEKEGEAP
jgi:predicted transcriptional regulator